MAQEALEPPPWETFNNRGGSCCCWSGRGPVCTRVLSEKFFLGIRWERLKAKLNESGRLRESDEKLPSHPWSQQVSATPFTVPAIPFTEP